MSVPETLPRVYGAIAAVMSEISSTGVAKARENRQQGYVFRGIDDMYNALSGPLSRANLVIIPRVISRDCQERQSAKGTPIFVVTVHVEFDIVSADDGSKHTAMTYGEAMDSADKATNKAMSAAWKYMAMELFCIPTDGDNDADADTPEVVTNLYSDERFSKNLPTWRELIRSGSKTSAEIIAMVSSKATLTPKQIAAIKKIQEIADENS